MWLNWKKYEKTTVLGSSHSLTASCCQQYQGCIFCQVSSHSISAQSQPLYIRNTYLLPAYMFILCLHSLCHGQQEARHQLFASAATHGEMWSMWTSFTDVSHLQVNLTLNLTKKHAHNQEQLPSTSWWKHWEKIHCPVAEVSRRTITLLSFPSKSWRSAMMMTSTLYMQQLKQKTRQLPAWAMH